MAIRTPEQLKQLFQESRERKQQELQQQKEAKKKQYQELCKQADQLLKDDQERAKKEKMEQLQALSEKTSQMALKRFYINLTNNRWIDDDKYTRHFNRQDLEKMCPKHINWKKWDEVVEQGRQKIRDMGIELKPSRDSINYSSPNRKISIMAYDLSDNPIGTYNSIPEASKALNIKIGTVTNTVYNRPDHICAKHQVKLIRTKL
jgi:GH24 family phage-related lysozyme (muramidase)